MLSGDQRKALGLVAAFLVLGFIPKAFPALRDLFLFYLLGYLALLAVSIAFGAWQLLRVARAKFANEPLHPHMSRLVFSLSIGLLFALSVLAMRLIPSALPTGSHDADFESVVWRSPDSAKYDKSGPTPRQKMLGSLIDDLERSPTREEVVELLGPPHSRGFPLGIGDSDIHYRTGPQRDAFFGLDSEWIFIWFDDSDHFERYSIYVD